MEDGTTRGPDFQNGRMKSYKSVEDYIYHLQDGKCVLCGAPIEHCHHIMPQSKGGSDGPENRVGLCSDCHAKVHTDKIKATLLDIGKKKRYAALSVLNQAMPFIYNSLIERFGEEHVHVCEGYDTKQIREIAGLSKDHNIDAACIAASYTGMLPKTTKEVYEIRQFRRHDRSIINNQRERTYKLSGKTVAKNRKPRFGQEGDSLQSYLAKLPEADRRRVCSQMQVAQSARRYNNLNRKYLPGCVFYQNKRRYVMSGQLSKGMYLRAVGCGDTNFRTSKCLIKRGGGLVYI